MSDYKPITGELRKVMNHTEMRNVPLVELGEYEFARRCDEIDAVHAGLERENAELRAARGDDWIKLPVDADGLPIHVGDELRDDWNERNQGEVEWLMLDRHGWWFRLNNSGERFYANEFHEWRHRHTPTVEDVLREFALKVAGEECMTMRTDVVEEFAKRLQLAGDAS